MFRSTTTDFKKGTIMSDKFTELMQQANTLENLTDTLSETYFSDNHSKNLGGLIAAVDEYAKRVINLLDEVEKEK